MPAPLDALVAGAGPVGLTAAVELARRGLRVRIVDAGAGPTPERESRALGVLPTTLRVLAPAGLSERMLAEGGRIRRVLGEAGGARLFELDLAHAGGPHPFLLAAPQGRTERLMIERLSELGVEVEWGRAVTGVERPETPRVRLSDGEEARPGLLVAADGARSTVRKALGVRAVGEAFPTRFALADAVHDRPIDTEVARFELRAPAGARDAAGAFAHIPFGDRTARLIGVAQAPEALLGRVEGVARVVWTSTFTVSFRRAERLSVGRVFLVGDAAHVHSPVGGRGMNLGIWDAAWLASLVETGRESEYHARRAPAADQVLAATKRATEALAEPPRWLEAALRLVGPVATRTPGLRARLARRVLALDLPQPDWV